ncbi:MAG TPA: response regulator [Acidimicrobiaceae bacterium]|jgi:response regulator NasT|uniref:Response regulatory domain-containing protein n=1 Tax=marine metagenome TaxID=408172 RepID=A0A381WHD8_9ZZZZ|nr:response regulator [Acidimicrobiaceae bacterium]
MTEEVRVALAEDDAIIRLDLRETLEEEGYTVVGDTGRGDEMLELVAATNPEVVILDIKMPGMDGIEVARCIAESHGAAVVILTAFSQREFIDQAIEAGALAYLVKPFQRSELVPAVEIARARHREMRAITDQAQTLANRLEDRKTIDRARGVLMDEVGLSETDAFRFIQQAAMNERANMADVARQVLEDGRRPES